MLKNNVAKIIGLVNGMPYVSRSRTSGLIAPFLLVLVFLLGFSLEARAAQPATTGHANIADSVSIVVEPPVRSRRSADATVKVNITNISSKTIHGPVRLVLSGLTAGVSLYAAGGTTTDPVISVLDPSMTLASGATKTLNLTILNGGTVMFSFTPVIERGVVIIHASSSAASSTAPSSVVASSKDASSVRSSTAVSSVALSSIAVSSTPLSSIAASSKDASSVRSSTAASSVALSSIAVSSTPLSSVAASSKDASSVRSSTAVSSVALSSIAVSSTPFSSIAASSKDASSVRSSTAVSSVALSSIAVSSTPLSSIAASSKDASSVRSSTAVSSVALSSTPISSVAASIANSSVVSSLVNLSSVAASASSTPMSCNNNATNYPQCDNTGLAVIITEPKSLLTIGHSPLTVKGRINRPNAILVINGNRVTHSDGVFSAQVTVQEGYNTIIASATDGTAEQVTDSIAVSLDLTPPYVTIDSHVDGQQVSTNGITVTGLVNDIVRGTIEAAQAQVRVNGIVAEVSNRSYSVKNIPLMEGSNQIKITAADQVGNTETKIITVRYSQPVGKRILLVSGQDQTASINSQLAKPLVVKLLNDQGQPVTGGSVIFRVAQDSGEVAIGTAHEGRAVVVQTNAQGEASTTFKLGLHTGTENNKVRAVAVGYEGEVVFTASAITKLGNKLSINSGNTQRGVMGQVLPAPLVTVVTDEGANVVSGARVRYESITGGGSFDGKQTSIEVVTDSDGRATARFFLGDLAGLDAQQVRATLVDAPQGQTIIAGFSASAFKTADPGLTRITGVVLDNQDNPIPGVTLQIEGTTRKAQSNAQGQFVITSAPVGPVHLVADGSTASVAGEFPNLSYNMVTIAGADNPLPAPIYMVKLNTKEAVYAGKQDVALTLEKFPGFKLEIAKNSVTFPDGSREGYVSVTAVNASAVPMAPPNGMQPQFIVTIQPTNTRFDPPATLSLPNVDGHAPGAQVEMYSYDHDLEEFVSIGLGSVTEDGSVIRSNIGVGVVKAGWHCGSQPGGSGTGEHCATCMFCDGTSCVEDPLQRDNPKDPQLPENCKTETCGGSRNDDADKPTFDLLFQDCKAPGCDGGEVIWNKEINDSDKPDDTDKGNCKKPGCKDGELEELDDSTDYLEDSEKGDCKKPGCDGGTPEDKNDDKDITTEQVTDCKECKEGDLVDVDFGSDCCFKGERISNFPIEDLEKCPNRVANGTAPTSNGCTAVPDNPNLLSQCGAPFGEGPNRPSFQQACNGHDIGYDQCNRPKATTDTEFRNAMNQACSSATIPECRIDCFDNADTYANTVSAIPNFYDDAQKNVCNCCSN